MKLIIGGMAQGKLAYTQKRWEQKKPGIQMKVGDETMSFSQMKRVDVLNHTHLIIRRMKEEGKNPFSLIEALCHNNPDLMIICDEVGMGLVPVEQSEREYREMVGKCMCQIAAQAEEVTRVICGLGERIK